MLAPRKWVCSSAWLERTPDKGEVGSSSLPRPTIHFNTNSLYKRALARFSKEYINSIAQNIKLLKVCSYVGLLFIIIKQFRI